MKKSVETPQEPENIDLHLAIGTLAFSEDRSSKISELVDRIGDDPLSLTTHFGHAVALTRHYEPLANSQLHEEIWYGENPRQATRGEDNAQRIFHEMFITSYELADALRVKLARVDINQASAEGQLVSRRIGKTLYADFLSVLGISEDDIAKQSLSDLDALDFGFAMNHVLRDHPQLIELLYNYVEHKHAEAELRPKVDYSIHFRQAQQGDSYSSFDVNNPISALTKTGEGTFESIDGASEHTVDVTNAKNRASKIQFDHEARFLSRLRRMLEPKLARSVEDTTTESRQQISSVVS